MAGNCGEKSGCGCGGRCETGPVDRRNFLKIAGLGVMATSLGGITLRANAQDAPTTTPAIPPEPPAPPPISHFVQAEKNLPPEWIKALYERGTKEVFRGDELKYIGMPINGIGTGQLYLCGDGTLGCWEIFNHHQFDGTGDRSYAPSIPEKPVDQGFAIIMESEGTRTVRALNKTGFAEVIFSGEYPIGRIQYKQPDFPLDIEMEAFSPFIPLNAPESALPATIFIIKAKNTSDKPVITGCAGWLENAVCHYTANDIPGMRRTRTINENGRTLIVHTAEDVPPPAGEQRPPILLTDFEGGTFGQWQPTGDAIGQAPVTGPLPGQQPVSGYEGQGYVNTFLNGDNAQGTLTSPTFPINRHYINFLIGGGNRPTEACINLIVDGAVVRTTTGDNNEKLSWEVWNVKDLEGKEGHIEIIDKAIGGWGHINIDHIELSDIRREGPSGPASSQHDFGTLTLSLGEESGDPQTAIEILSVLGDAQVKQFSTTIEPYPFPERRNGALISGRGEIAPGAERAFVFVLSWHFPNALHGHEYANRFPDAPAVAHYIFDNFDRLTAQTRAWRDTYYDSTLPYWLLDRLHNTASYLSTGVCHWWKNGRFWAWEGVACCEGTCSHVWNYAHTEARLFPQLARSVREMQDFAPRNDTPESGGFHPDTGLIGFRSNDAYAADGQCGSILKAYREHCMSPNNDFLNKMWPNIKKALEFTIQQDATLQPGAPDGLIENSQPNTYDINFEGPNTFVGALYLAALRAGEEMAREMGDTAFADQCHNIFESGKKLSIEQLWNGEYFIQRVDLNQFPRDQYGDGCLADQLFGQGWAHQTTLGYIYPTDNIKQALQSLYKYNWATDVGPQNAAHKPLRWFATPGEKGLFTCTWPKSPYLENGVIYKDEVWTGSEYQVAGHMIWEGLLEQGLALCRAIHERYTPAKRNPYNEVECGDHYARALASWGVFLALTGYEHHGPKAHLGFAPRFSPENFKAAFTTAEGWGSFSQKRENNTQQEHLELHWGKLRLKTLAFTVPDGITVKTTTITLGGNPLEATFTANGNHILITLAQEQTIEPGPPLDILIS